MKLKETGSRYEGHRVKFCGFYRAFEALYSECCTKKNSTGSSSNRVSLAMDWEQLKQKYDRDGFVVLRNHLALDELSQMQAQLRYFHNEVTQGQYRASGVKKSMDKEHAWFRHYLVEGPHIKLMKFILQDSLSPDNVSWIGKPEGVARTLPHFDALGSYRVSPSGISLWIAMDRIDRSNGCLHYEKGSHKREYESVYPLPDYDENNAYVFPVEVNPGDAIMHSTRTVHWSIEPLTDRERNAMVFAYWGGSSDIDPVKAERSNSAYRDGNTVL
jgi:phytanoyl-CoA hydroxylase